jgi:hypothetical protein
MQELPPEQRDMVTGGQFSCSLSSMRGAAASFGVGGGVVATAGATTDKSAAAAAGGFLGTALVGAALIGYSIGVGINHAIGQCD